MENEYKIKKELRGWMTLAQLCPSHPRNSIILNGLDD
jgi:hypothetical protein